MSKPVINFHHFSVLSHAYQACLYTKEQMQNTQQVTSLGAAELFLK
jgi:hypothetical protein